MEERGINFYDFSWAASMSYLSLLALVSIAMFLLVKERSFRHYFIYAIFLLLYVATKHPTLDFVFHNLLKIGENNHYSSNFNWWVQVVFYTYYTLFAYYILDLDSVKPKIVSKIRYFIYAQLAFSTLLLIVGLAANQPVLYYFFLYWFIPVMLILMFYFMPVAMRTPGQLKWVILTGIIVYISSALVALYYSLRPSPQFPAPIVFFFLGIIIENICFSIAIALKYKQINEEKAFKTQEIANLEYQRKLASLRGSIKGEQTERKRIAAELHDGLGNLTATALLQFEHARRVDSCLNKNDSYAKGIQLLEDISDDVRNIAHNLMPKTLTKLGLIRAVNEIAENIDHPKIIVETNIERIPLNDEQAFVLFRMIQECINNIMKHANADMATIFFNQANDQLKVTITDNGVGFDTDNYSGGLGLQNLKSRSEIIGGTCLIQSNHGRGTTISFTIPVLK